MAEITYQDSGVDIVEGAKAVDSIKAAVKSTYRPEVVGDIGGFAGLFSIASAKDMEEPLLVSGTDGVGTKLQLAKMLNKHDTIGQDLVAMCVNDILATGAEPLFFLDYVAAGKIESGQISEIVGGIASACKESGCSLIGGEMAEHPGVMPVDDYDLSGFCVGIVDKPKMLNPANTEKGDILIGLPSSGVHSNGFSLVRKACIEGKPESELKKPQERFGGKSILEAFLTPTNLYVKTVLCLLEGVPDAVASLSHITGGGITENLNRAISQDLDAIVKLGSWEIPEIIKYACECANLSEEQALKTFNMGLGMILIVKPDRVEDVKSALNSCGQKFFEVGKLDSGSGKVRYE